MVLGEAKNGFFSCRLVEELSTAVGRGPPGPPKRAPSDRLALLAAATAGRGRPRPTFPLVMGSRPGPDPPEKFLSPSAIDMRGAMPRSSAVRPSLAAPPPLVLAVRNFYPVGGRLAGQVLALLPTLKGALSCANSPDAPQPLGRSFANAAALSPSSLAAAFASPSLRSKASSASPACTLARLKSA